MAFPQSVLPVRVKIAPGGAPAGDPGTWKWEDITDDVRVAAGITIEFGRGDEANRVDPAKCTLTLDCRSGDYSPRNVAGKWHGKLGKNTPLRVGTVAVSDTFTRTTANGWGTAPTGQPWATSGTAADWSTDGAGAHLAFAAANVARFALVNAATFADFDVQFTSSVPAVMTGASMVVGLYARWADVNNNYILSVEYDPGGAVTAKIRRRLAGTFTELAALAGIAGLTYTAGTVLRTRVYVDGPDLRIKVWRDGQPEPDAWTLTATDSTLQDAGYVGFYLWLVTGNTNTKPFSVTVDDLELEDIEFTGTVPEWPVRWDKSGKDSTTPVVAAGVLRRLQQGKSPLRSPIVRNFLRYNPVAYWPLEDGSGATTAASAITGGEPATARAVEFAADTTLPGSATAVGITASSVMTGRVPRHTATGKWGMVFYTKLLAPPAAPTRIMTVTASGSIRTWTVDMDSVAIQLRGYAADGTKLLDVEGAYTAETTPPVWTAFDLYVSQSGFNVTGSLLFHAVGDNTGWTYYYITQTVSGTAGSPTGWRAEGSLGFNGGRLAHVAVFNTEPPFASGADFTAASNGYIGEKAADRIRRLCAEEGMPVVIEPGDSEPLGPQRPDTFLNLLRSAEDADLGILYERGAGLAYRPRTARYNRPVDMALDFASGHIGDPPEPTDDDQRLRNQWTVTREGGSTAVAVDETSVATVGLYDDTATINVQTDDVLGHHAGWRLHLGTIDELRWPRIELNLARNPHLAAVWRAAGWFPRVTVANEPSQVAGNDVDVIVEGYTQTLTPYGWDVVLNCSPASAWTVGVYNAATTRYSTTGSTLAAPASASAATLSINAGSRPWSTTAVPYDIEIDGERITVTAMTAATPQVATVTRGVNGIAKSHETDAAVNLWTPARYAL